MGDKFTSPREIAQLNIEHYSKLLQTSLDEVTRTTVEKLLANEKAKLAMVPDERHFPAAGLVLGNPPIRPLEVPAFSVPNIIAPALVTVGVGESEMTIRRLLQNSPVSPGEIVRLRIAYQKSLHALHLVDRNDPVSEIVAKKVIQIASTGVRDPAQICKIVIKQLGFG